MIKILIYILAVIGGITLLCTVFVIAFLTITEITDRRRAKGGINVGRENPPSCSLSEENCIHPDDDWNCDDCEVYEEFKQIGDR